MTRPLSLADFDRLPPRAEARLVAGLSAEIDAVAARAAETHRFLRYDWFAAAVAAHGGHPRTLVVREDGVSVLALPLIGLGPPAIGLATVPGSYWPFRSFPLALEASAAAPAAALGALDVRGIRLGPVPDGDPGAAALVAAAGAAGWTVLDRIVGAGRVHDLPDPAWPRASSLEHNRFPEKPLAEHGELDWRHPSAAVDGLLLRDWLMLRPGVSALVGRLIARRAGFVQART